MPKLKELSAKNLPFGVEVLVPSLIQKDCVEEGFTQSEIAILNECGFKWHLMYNLRLSSHNPQWHFAIGSAWHKIMENLYESKGRTFQPFGGVKLDPYVDCTPEVQALQEQEERILIVYAEEYMERFKDEFATLQISGLEQIHDLTIDWKGQKIRLKGMIDLAGQIGSHEIIMDHKSSKNISQALMRGWQFRFQFMFYHWINQQIKGKRRVRFVINAMRKPSIRVKKFESLNGFLQRLRAEIRSDPTKYFFRETLILSSGQLERFESQTLAPKLNKLALIQNPATPANVLSAIVLDKNTEACVNIITGAYCPFFEICEKDLSADRFTRREHKHPELAGV